MGDGAGDGAFSMRRLADSAQISVATLESMFRSKEDLRLALYASAIDAITRAIQVVPLTCPIARSRAIMEAAVTELASEPTFYKPGFLAAVTAHSAAQEALNARAADLFREALEHAMARGLLRHDLEPEVLASHIFDGFQRAAHLWSRDAIDTDDLRSRALYTLYVSLLGAATDETRPGFLAQLESLEGALSAATRRRAAAQAVPAVAESAR